VTLVGLALASLVLDDTNAVLLKVITDSRYVKCQNVLSDGNYLNSSKLIPTKLRLVLTF